MNLVLGEWVMGKAGEVYRDFAPLFYGRWGDYIPINQDTLLTMEAFIADDGRYAVAFVNKNNFDVITTLGFTAPQRSYGVIYYDSVVGLEESLYNPFYYNLYPNPVSDELTIEVKGNNEKVNFEIVNGMGSIIYQGNFKEKTIVNTSSFPPGVYFIKLENKKLYEFKKVVKE